MNFRTWLIALLWVLPLAGGCRHQTTAEEREKALHPDESDVERNERHRREAEAAKQQAAREERFRKGLAVIQTVKAGDAYDDFYRKTTQARLGLERVTNTADGRVERYSFLDNSNAFVVVVVKADHVTEIRTEGVGQ